MERIFENSTGFVIFDKFPVSEGHCLVVPHRVYSNYFDSNDEVRTQPFLFSNELKEFDNDSTLE